MNGCKVSGCTTPTVVKGRKVGGHGWCRKHYARWYKYGTTELPTRERTDPPCSVDGCTKPLRNSEGVRKGGNGLCSTHYQRLRINGTTDRIDRRGSNSHNWKGGRLRTKDGYIRLRIDPKDPLFEHGTVIGGSHYMMEHRAVMSRHLGRPLETYENVHHINGVRDDNRIENLELWSSMQPTGQRVSDLHEELIDLRAEVDWRRRVVHEIRRAA